MQLKYILYLIIKKQTNKYRIEIMILKELNEKKYKIINDCIYNL